MAAQFGANPDCAKLNEYLLTKSYISGFEATAEDVAVFKALAKAPAAEFVNALRWYNHINSFSAEFSKLGGAAPAAKNDEEEEEDDDMDFFGSDDEEEDAEAERVKAERVAAYNARKAEKAEKKGVVAAKSMITLDIKPFDDETDLQALAAKIKSEITMDGLVWADAEYAQNIAFDKNDMTKTKRLKAKIDALAKDSAVQHRALNADVAAMLALEKKDEQNKLSLQQRQAMVRLHAKAVAHAAPKGVKAARAAAVHAEGAVANATAKAKAAATVSGDAKQTVPSACLQLSVVKGVVSVPARCMHYELVKQVLGEAKERGGVQFRVV